jgi:hypothetical protein
MKRLQPVTDPPRRRRPRVDPASTRTRSPPDLQTPAFPVAASAWIMGKSRRRFRASSRERGRRGAVARPDTHGRAAEIDDDEAPTGRPALSASSPRRQPRRSGEDDSVQRFNQEVPA